MLLNSILKFSGHGWSCYVLCKFLSCHTHEKKNYSIRNLDPTSARHITSVNWKQDPPMVLRDVFCFLSQEEEYQQGGPSSHGATTHKMYPFNSTIPSLLATRVGARCWHTGQKRPLRTEPLWEGWKEARNTTKSNNKKEPSWMMDGTPRHQPEPSTLWVGFLLLFNY